MQRIFILMIGPDSYRDATIKLLLRRSIQGPGSLFNIHMIYSQKILNPYGVLIVNDTRYPGFHPGL